MSEVTYLPFQDELILTLFPHRDVPTKEIGPFRVWYDENGRIQAMVIRRYSEELRQFQKNSRAIRLEGIWRSVRITEEDVKEARSELLKKLEGKD